MSPLAAKLVRASARFYGGIMKTLSTCRLCHGCGELVRVDDPDVPGGRWYVAGCMICLNRGRAGADKDLIIKEWNGEQSEVYKTAASESVA